MECHSTWISDCPYVSEFYDVYTRDSLVNNYFCEHVNIMSSQLSDWLAIDYIVYDPCCMCNDNNNNTTVCV